MRLIVKLILLLSVITHYGLSQSPAPCGTAPGRSDWLINYQAEQLNNPTSRTTDWIVVPIVVHITGEDNGAGYTSANLIGQSIHIMNEVFEQAKIQFFLSQSYRYINNSVYHNHTSFSVGQSMMQNHKVAGAINLFICEDAAGNCGYYSFSRDAIAINDDCLDPDNHTLAHEKGHLLSLPHPFDGWEGVEYDDSQPTPNFISGHAVERVDGSNCQSAGDGFCDTAPDYLSDRWNCNGNGESNQVQFDPDGASFRSQGNLIMGYSIGSCRDYFSPDQSDAMRANLLSVRSSILNHNRIYKPLTSCGRVELITPAQLDSVQHDAVELYWSPFENADYYTVEISNNINFSNIIFTQQLTDSILVLTHLDLGRNYFWRVSGFAAHSPCITTSRVKWFFTYDFSQTVEVSTDTYITSYISDDQLHVRSNENSILGGQLRLFNLAGQMVQTHKFNEKETQFSSDVSHLSAGIYFVELSGLGFRAVFKVIK